MEKTRSDAISRIAAGVTWLRRVDHAPDDIAGVLALNDAGHCVFHTPRVLAAETEKGPAPFPETPRRRSAGCYIHATLGHHAIPLACQHFPRVCVIDGRGVFVTLSHYCPTAVSLLFEAGDERATVVDGPPALPGGALPEGLDAREELPPLRNPRLLEEYGLWERDVVRVLTTIYPAERALAELSRDITNGAGPFSVSADSTLFAMARQAVPAPYAWPDYVARVGDELRSHDAVVGRYLAAHAFASWMAYQGQGLASIVAYLHVVLAVLRTEVARRQSLVDGIRHADLLLRHLADREVLAAALAPKS